MCHAWYYQLHGLCCSFILKDTTKLIKQYVLGWVQSAECIIFIHFLLSLKRGDDG